MTIYMMSVREINRLTLTGKPVVARYVLDGIETQGRIMRARRRHGRVEVQCLTSGRWAVATSAAEIWEA